MLLLCRRLEATDRCSYLSIPVFLTQVPWYLNALQILYDMSETIIDFLCFYLLYFKIQLLTEFTKYIGSTSTRYMDSIIVS